MNSNEKILSMALCIGEQMLISGAEVSRVEDTVTRILKCYSATEINVHTITSLIIVTVRFGNEEIYTQSKRIKQNKTDFSKLDAYNDLSRRICSEKPEIDKITYEIEKINNLKGYSLLKNTAAFALISGTFTIFFGGRLYDSIFSAIIGAFLSILKYLSEKTGLNMLISNILCSFSATFFAHLSAVLWGCDADKIIIGNIMPLIPGIALTNSIRDVMNGDIITGFLRFFEACLIALAIAGGYFLAFYVSGGIIWSI